MGQQLQQVGEGANLFADKCALLNDIALTH
jgi:hypothetical protein